MKKVAEGVYRMSFEEFYPTLQEYGAEPEALEMFYEELCNIPKSRKGKIKKKFLWWPRWTNDIDIFPWFDQHYPGGLRKLMYKRMSKKFGTDETEYEEDCENLLKKYNISHLLATAPDLVKIRQYQKERHEASDGQKGHN